MTSVPCPYTIHPKWCGGGCWFTGSALNTLTTRELISYLQNQLLLQLSIDTGQLCIITYVVCYAAFESFTVEMLLHKAVFDSAKHLQTLGMAKSPTVNAVSHSLFPPAISPGHKW
jgi:hypothetical protein